MQTNYYYLEYDARITALFSEGEIITLGGTGSGQAEIIDVIPSELISGEGYLYVADLGTLSITDNATITSDGSGTAVVNSTGVGGNISSYQTKYPAFMRKDVTIAINGDIRWDTAPAAPVLFVTHSCQFDGQTVNLTLNNILTFSGGGTAELITQTDGGVSGEIQFRLITLPMPLDNETFTDEGSGNGVVNGVVHDRTYTPLHLHRFLGDLGDDAVATGDDLFDITDTDASLRSTDEIIDLQGTNNVDQTLTEHMYGGSLSESDGTVWSGLAISLTVNNPDTQPIVIQVNAATGIDELVTNRWRNAYNPDALKGQVRIILKTVDAGVVINGSRVRVRIAHYQDTSFLADATIGVGETGVSLFSSPDLNNTTLEATISALLASDPPATVEGYQEFDYLNGNGSNPFHLSYNIDVDVSRGDFYEQSKFIARFGTTENIYGRNAQLFVGADLNFPFNSADGVGGFTQSEYITFSGGAKAMLLAMESLTGTSGNMYCQLISGVAPADGETILGDTSGETAAINGTVVTRTINTHYLGQYTGTGFITNYGIAFVVADGTKSDKFADLLGIVQEPPNNVTFTASGFVVGEDYVVAANNNGGNIDYTQYTLNGVHSTSATVTVNGTIDTDTPTTGTIRVLRADGKYDRLAYDSFDSVTGVFTLNEVNTCTAANAANCFQSYIDKLADATAMTFSYIYSVGNGDRTIFVKARDGKFSPTKTSTAQGVMTTGGGSATINRVTDA